MLKQRIITALWLAPLALGGFFLLDGLAFALFIALVVGLGGWEWARMAGLQTEQERRIYAVAVLIGCAALWFMPQLAAVVLLLALIWWVTAFALLLGYPASAACWRKQGVRLGIGFILLLPAWQGLLLLKQWPQGNQLILLVMLLVWLADIGAYFTGRAFGRVKLAPEVSPGKSREGVYGGMACSLLLVAGIGLYQDWTARELLMALLGSALVVCSSVVGDLTESMFKRQAGIKDSSNLLPGHGGILDRIDSLTAAVPVFTVLLWLHGWGNL